MTTKAIRARVYRRTQQEIVLLCDTVELGEMQKKNIAVSVQDGDHTRPLTRAASSEEGIKIRTPNTEMIVIPHQKNGLSPHEDYWLTITFGLQGTPEGQVEVRKQVFMYGVLPQDEKDDSRRNAHIYGFDEERRRWLKVPVVEYKGQVCVPVVILNADELRPTIKRTVISLPVAGNGDEGDTSGDTDTVGHPATGTRVE